MALNVHMQCLCIPVGPVSLFYPVSITYARHLCLYIGMCVYGSHGVVSILWHCMTFIYIGYDRQYIDTQLATKWGELQIIDWPLSGLQALHINSHQVQKPHSRLRKLDFRSSRFHPWPRCCGLWKWPCVNVLLTKPWQCTLWPWWIWCGLGPHWFERCCLNLEPLFKWTSLQLVATKRTSPWCCCLMRSNGNRSCPSWRRETATVPQISARPWRWWSTS